MSSAMAPISITADEPLLKGVGNRVAFPIINVRTDKADTRTQLSVAGVGKIMARPAGGCRTGLIRPFTLAVSERERKRPVEALCGDGGKISAKRWLAA